MTLPAVPWIGSTMIAATSLVVSISIFLRRNSSGPAARWLLTLGLYDLVFGLIAFALFDFLLED